MNSVLGFAVATLSIIAVGCGSAPGDSSEEIDQSSAAISLAWETVSWGNDPSGLGYGWDYPFPDIFTPSVGGAMFGMYQSDPPSANTGTFWAGGPQPLVIYGTFSYRCDNDPTTVTRTFNFGSPSDPVVVAANTYFSKQLDCYPTTYVSTANITYRPPSYAMNRLYDPNSTLLGRNARPPQPTSTARW